MKWFALAALIILTIGIFSCSDDSPTGTAASTTVTFCATVMAYKCAGPPETHYYSQYSGRPATVTLTRSDSTKFIGQTDTSSVVRMAVDTGDYAITVETFHASPKLIANLHISGDTSGVILLTRIMYDPPDLINATFKYVDTGAVLDTAKERQTLQYLSAQLGNMLDISGSRRRVTGGPTAGPATVTYSGIAITANLPSWKVLLAAHDSIAAHPEQIDSGFTTFGYPVPCIEGNP
jgi:hypothetical protein